MSSWFYTDADATQQGPVDDQTLLGLNESGAVHARSLVWKESMPEWTPFGAVAEALFGSVHDDVEPFEIGICAHSGRVYPATAMLPYGEALIGPDEKDNFVQQLMESSAIEIVDATESHLEYVGFWWRCLSSLLDYLIKMVPSWIFMIPFYVVSITMSGPAESGNVNAVTGMTVWMGIAYGFGLLGMLLFSIFYETWMVGKYEATLGKLIIGAKVVNPDGTRLTYKRAFVRWLAKKPLNYILIFLPSSIGFGLVVAGAGSVAGDGGSGVAFAMAMMSGIFVYLALLILSCGVYWMAAFDREKRALHDRLSSTRVVKK